MEIGSGILKMCTKFGVDSLSRFHFTVEHGHTDPHKVTYAIDHRTPRRRGIIMAVRLSLNSNDHGTRT